MKKFSGKTIVITGASSGLGRGAALAFARQGANVGLIARSQDGLATLADEIKSIGSRAIALPLDVTDAESMRRAASRVARTFGRIDVWVNNAAVAVYGEADKVPLEELRRIMDVNFFGQVNGVRAALPFLEESNGRLIGVLSVLSEAATPLQSVYVASKHALFGYYKCLREELAHRRSRVKITTLFVPSIATPLFDHAKTYTGFRPRPLAPIYPPERVVAVLLQEARRSRPKFARVISGFGHLATFLFRNAPALAHWFQGKTGYKAQRSPVPKAASEGDNLYAPMPGWSTVHGSTKAHRLVDRIERSFRPIAVAGIVAAALWLGSRFLRRRPTSSGARSISPGSSNRSRAPYARTSSPIR